MCARHIELLLRARRGESLSNGAPTEGLVTCRSIRGEVRMERLLERCWTLDVHKRRVAACCSRTRNIKLGDVASDVIGASGKAMRGRSVRVTLTPRRWPSSPRASCEQSCRA